MDATATPTTQEVTGTAKVTVAEVTLRKFELSDVDAMMAWASDPQVAAPCRWDAYESTEPLLAFIRDTVLPHPWFRAICLESGSGRPVGAVSVSPTGDPCRAELGYVLARAHWGRGVATAAVKRAVATVFADVLLRETGLEDGRDVADRIRRAISDVAVPRHGVLVTASAGVAERLSSMAHHTELVALADAALYRAKREGRDQVATATD